MYNVYGFLEQVGISSEIPIPTAPQHPNADPWANSFPPDRQTYRLRDEEDGTDRCPACLHEIYQNHCEYCDAEFSGSDVSDDFEIDTLSVTDEEEIAPTPNRRHRGRRARGARVDIASIEEVLGDSEDDNEDRARDQIRRLEIMAEAGDGEIDSNIGSGSEDEAEGFGLGFDEEMDTDDEIGQLIIARPRRALAGRVVQPQRRSRSPSEDEEDEEEYPEDGRRPRNWIDVPAPRPGRARQYDRAAPGPGLIDLDASEDDEGSHEGSEIGTQYDSDEDDGAVPRRLRHHSLSVDEEDDESSRYEDSFIDDEEEQDDLEVDSGVEVGSNDTENENDAEEMIQIASDEEDEGGRAPNMQELRRRRLTALIRSRSDDLH
jgi:hypothetical protein